MVEVRDEVDRKPLRKVDKDAARRVVIFDVWSRSGSKYRVRAVVLLIINLVLFGCLGCFAFWMRTGSYLAPVEEGYWSLLWKTCLPGSDSHTLTSMLTFPINLEKVPLQIVIHGLLLSALVSVPILVSILYRFYSCLPFVAVVCFLAVMPWLALTLLGSCILASLRPFRFSFRYASALLGLVLVVLYIVGVSLQNVPAAAVLTHPGHRVKLVTPWILAVLASCVLLGLGLALAKLVNYRPGVIAPLLATMFALPIALFEKYVGRDELYYRLLEHHYGPRSTYFQDQDVQKAFDRSVAALHDLDKPDRAYEEIASLHDLRWQLELEGTPDRRNLLTIYREQAARDCDWFIKYFPDSRYAPAALYLKGRALDMRVDPVQFRENKKLVFYDSYPSIASHDSWLRLVTNAPQSPLSAVGLYRLAILEARGGNVDQAIDYLRRLPRFEKAEATTLPTAGPMGFRSLLATAPPESGLQVAVAGVVFEGKRLLGLLENNRDPLYGDAPITGSGGSFPRLGWMLFDPRSGHYRRNLRDLLKRYPHCQLADNIDLELAQTVSEPAQRPAALQGFIEEYSGRSEQAWGFRDALPEAIYWLGEAELSSLHLADARKAFERLVSEYPDSVWRERAERRLAVMKNVGQR
ncbi:MAG: tetratricopeptide repeat protein [Phycisphaerae bacterium]|nr:tetratricopeptide repeat protein [Phycisphaerae bacterium]